MLYTLPFVAYLIGSISSAILIARVFQMTDPRSVGSGNPGATNILRQGNKIAALLTLLGDIFKGLLPVLAARFFTNDSLILALVAGAAFIGHLFPVFFGFRGGKGVATGLGVYFGLHWAIGLGLVACWLLVAAVFRYSSLAAVVTAAASPLIVAYWLPQPAFVILSIVLACMLVWRHRENVRRLLRGEEDKINFSKS